jgi:hypothetical protein
MGIYIMEMGCSGGMIDNAWVLRVGLSMLRQQK